MIFNSPLDLLSLHKNIQYYNTHKKSCSLDSKLNVINKSEMKELNKDIPEQIFKCIKEYYTASRHDDKWLKLIKNDIYKLEIDSTDIINKIDLLQQITPKGPKPVDWLKLGILNVFSVFDLDAADDNGSMRKRLYYAIRSPDNLLVSVQIPSNL
jgi:hypothetical protein